MKNLFKAVFLIVIFFNVSPCLSQETTTWKPVKRSLASLLDDGWRIVTSNDMQWEEAIGSQLVILYVLEKGGKYVRCEIVDPSINKATSTCLALN